MRCIQTFDNICKEEMEGRYGGSTKTPVGKVWLVCDDVYIPGCMRDMRVVVCVCTVCGCVGAGEAP